jgi:hypothetical protein
MIDDYESLLDQSLQAENIKQQSSMLQLVGRTSSLPNNTMNNGEEDEEHGTEEGDLRTPSRGVE